MASAPGDIKLDVCCLTESRPLPGTPNGQIIKISGINSYYIEGKDVASKGKIIVLLTDIFGKDLYNQISNKNFFIELLKRSNKKSMYDC